MFELSPIISWFPNESVFSLASRYHLLSGNRIASQTCTQLFGHSRAGSQHDLPCRIGVFADRNQGLLGDADQIIQHHTLLPFYTAFRTPIESNRAYAALQGASIGGLKTLLGMVASRFGASHPLKACTACLIEDGEEFGTGYWRRDHQVPGNWICHRHGTVLQVALVKSNGVGRFLWTLPPEIDSNIWWSPPTIDALATTRLTQLGRLAAQLCNLPRAEALDPLLMAQVYRAGLERNGLTRGSQLRAANVGPELQGYIAPLRTLPELVALPSTPESAVTFIRSLLSTPRANTHPIRHLVAIAWLFQTWESFRKQLDELYLSSKGPEPSSLATEASPVKAKRDEFVAALRDRPRSISLMAKQFNIVVGTAIAWAAAGGVTASRRPKVLKEELREVVVAALKKGDEKRDVAAVNGISLQIVTRLLQSEPGLPAAWQTAHFARAQAKARLAVETIARTGHVLGIKQVRLANPAAYAWLFRNDREWLATFAQSILSARRFPLARVNWDERDRTLADEVRREGYQLATSAPGRLTIGKLCQRLPHLKPRLSSLAQLPLTARAIDTAIRRKGRIVLEATLFDEAPPYQSKE